MKIETLDDMKEAARRIHAMNCCSVLVKGGHASGDAVDVLFDGTDFRLLEAHRIDTNPCLFPPRKLFRCRRRPVPG